MAAPLSNMHVNKLSPTTTAEVVAKIDDATSSFTHVTEIIPTTSHTVVTGDHDDT